jgi:hypothetical protein
MHWFYINFIGFLRIDSIDYALNANLSLYQPSTKQLWLFRILWPCLLGLFAVIFNKIFPLDFLSWSFFRAFERLRAWTLWITFNRYQNHIFKMKIIIFIRNRQQQASLYHRVVVKTLGRNHYNWLEDEFMLNISHPAEEKYGLLLISNRITILPSECKSSASQ